MGDVIDIKSKRIEHAQRRPHVCMLDFLALCMSCFGRWIGAAPVNSNLFTLECPYCQSLDSFVAVLPNDLTISGDPKNGA